MSISGRPAVVDRLCDFFVVATQTILYVRGVYPRETFEAREKYGVPVYISRSPLLSGYVRDNVASFRDWMLQDVVNTVVVAVHRTGSEKSVVAKYMFDLAILTEGTVSPVSLSRLDAQFRAHILRITAVQADSDCEEELCFGFVLHTKGVEPFPHWMPASEGESCLLRDGVTIPLKDADEKSDTAFLASRIEMPLNQSNLQC